MILLLLKGEKTGLLLNRFCSLRISKFFFILTNWSISLSFDFIRAQTKSLPVFGYK